MTQRSAFGLALLLVGALGFRSAPAFAGPLRGGPMPAPDGPPPGDDCAIETDPVNLSTGLFVLRETDLFLPDTLPIALTRTYRQNDDTMRPFGRGGTHPYAIYLQTLTNYQTVDLFLADGGRLEYRLDPPTQTPGPSAQFAYHGPASSCPGSIGLPLAFNGSTITWNADQSQYELTLRDGTVLAFYEHSAFLKSIRDRNNNRITITHAGNGENGDITQITSPAGRWIALTYDTSVNPHRIHMAQDNSGRTVIYGYDSNGNLGEVTDPENHTTTYGYDGSNRLSSIQSPGGSVPYLFNGYYPDGRVKQQTRFGANGLELFTFTYTVTGATETQTAVTEPLGVQRTVSFNAAGYMTSDVRAGQGITQGIAYGRNPDNTVDTITDALGRVTKLTYDPAGTGNLLSVTQMYNTSAAATTTFHYDHYNQVDRITDPLSNVKLILRDPHGNFVGMFDAGSNVQIGPVFIYNDFGQPAQMIDALERSTTFGYDGGDLVTVTDANGTTRRAVDSAGRLVAFVDPLGHRTQFMYDNVNHLTSVTDPRGGETDFQYDADGNLHLVRDALGHETTYDHDALHRLMDRTDPLNHTESFTYDQRGRLAQWTDRRGFTRRFKFDALDRLRKRSAPGASYSYVYDMGNRLTQVIGGGATVKRTYNDLAREVTETTHLGAITYHYDANGRRHDMTIGSQPELVYDYEPDDQLHTISQNGQPIVTAGYNQARQRTGLALPNGVGITYIYDANTARLSEILFQAGNALNSLTYAYDPAGHRTSAGGTWAGTALPLELDNATYDAANRPQSWDASGFSHDANGNLISNGLDGLTYRWDHMDQLAAISGPEPATFRYDGLGRRVKKTVNGVTTAYLYDGMNPVLEQSRLNTTSLLTGLGVDEFFSRTDNHGAAQTFLTDALGSTIALAGASGVSPASTYEPFGYTTASPVPNEFQFTGRENDGTGLYYYRARYYHPVLQRFISEDPIGFWGGDTNLYGYVLNDPTNWVDPFGLEQDFPGVATYYNLPGSNTASGIPFDPNALAAAMVRGHLPFGTIVTIEYSYVDPRGEQQTQSTCAVINDRGPFARGPNGKALQPLQPDPIIVIDLTPREFRNLAGSLRAGRIQVTVRAPD